MKINKKIFFLILLAALFFPVKNILATDAACTAAGGNCNNTATECLATAGSTIISGVATQCTTLPGNVCCKPPTTPPPPPSGECKSGLVPCGRNCDNPDTTKVDETKPCTLCHFIVGIQGLINYGFKIMVGVAIFMITIGGVMYIVSTGQKLMEKAKEVLLSTLKGFAIMLAAWLIVNTLLYYIGASDNSGKLKDATTATWGEYSCTYQ